MRDALVVIDVRGPFDHEDGDPLLASVACATTDEELERLAFEYVERVVGVRVDRAS